MKKLQNLKDNIEKILNGEIEINYVPAFRKHLQNSKSLGEHKCFECGNDGKWNNKPLSLELEHIDGNRNNNKRENLKWLCPNCHSQTQTYRKNNRNKISKKILVSEEDLIYSIKKGGSVSDILKRVNLKATGDNFNRVYKVQQKYKIT
jgi:Zn finger protein HypA/HybF involved in hydrogenase expression